MATAHRTIPDLTQQDARRFFAKVAIAGKDDCWEWTAMKNNDGYGRFQVKHQHYAATRIAFKLRYKMDPGPWLMCHTCHNRGCVNWRHLYAGTPRDNTRDALERGTLYTAYGDDHWTHKNPEKVARGSRVGGVKLTPSDVIQIRAEYADRRASQAQLARRYGVTQACVSALIKRKTWTSV